MKTEKSSKNHAEIIDSWPWRIKKTGLTQGQFCEKIGIYRSYLSEYVNTKKEPSLGVFFKIENALEEMGVPYE